MVAQADSLLFQGDKPVEGMVRQAMVRQAMVRQDA